MIFATVPSLFFTAFFYKYTFECALYSLSHFILKIQELFSIIKTNLYLGGI